MEKRKHERYEELSEIVYTQTGKESYSNAMMGNCSMGGMYFSSKAEIPEGTCISVKMIAYKSIFNAEVVRCVKSGDTKFGIGIKYLEEVPSV